ncbi:hypothetical protein HKX48_004456 [Thoreauomyces humboldtii]|nr:hypothetical protein HKX48_004456 [Thoreauomyces humboldtii]
MAGPNTNVITMPFDPFSAQETVLKIAREELAAAAEQGSSSSAAKVVKLLSKDFRREAMAQVADDNKKWREMMDERFWELQQPSSFYLCSQNTTSPIGRFKELEKYRTVMDERYWELQQPSSFYLCSQNTTSPIGRFKELEKYRTVMDERFKELESLKSATQSLVLRQLYGQIRAKVREMAPNFGVAVNDQDRPTELRGFSELAQRFSANSQAMQALNRYSCGQRELDMATRVTAFTNSLDAAVHGKPDAQYAATFILRESRNQQAWRNAFHLVYGVPLMIMRQPFLTRTERFLMTWNELETPDGATYIPSSGVLLSA